MAAVCGIDWAAEHHDVRIADEHSGALLAERRFAHDEDGIGALIEAADRPATSHASRSSARTGCWSAGCWPPGSRCWRSIPTRSRPRAIASAPPPASPTASTRFVLRELGRTDSHRFPALAPCGDETLALRALVRTREDLVAARVALANQLRAQLDAFWPGAARIFADIDSPIALAFLARYPSPRRRPRPRPQAPGRVPRPPRLLRPQDARASCSRGCARRPPPRSASTRPTHAATPSSAWSPRCAPLVGQISQLTSEIRGAIRAHPDGPIFLSFFRDPKSVVCAAGLLAEIGDNRARYPTDDTLAADGGQAPVTKQSGKHRAVSFRWACDKRLRNHLGVLADSTRHWHPWAHDVYQRAIDRGCDHPHAIRILGRAWTRVLWRCWQDRVPYDPTQHRALTRHLATKG